MIDLHLNINIPIHQVSKTHNTEEELLLNLHSISLLFIATILSYKQRRVKGNALNIVDFDCIPPRLCPTIRSS